MAFLDMQPKATLASILEIALIETGSRSAREHGSSCNFAICSSMPDNGPPFGEIGLAIEGIQISTSRHFPILKREELRKQVASEGHC